MELSTPLPIPALKTTFVRYPSAYSANLFLWGSKVTSENLKITIKNFNLIGLNLISTL